MHIIGISRIERFQAVLTGIGLILVQVLGLNMRHRIGTLKVQCVAYQAFPLIPNLGQAARNEVLSLGVEICRKIRFLSLWVGSPYFCHSVFFFMLCADMHTIGISRFEIF